jgi:hypothetical protein
MRNKPFHINANRVIVRFGSILQQPVAKLRPFRSGNAAAEALARFRELLRREALIHRENCYGDHSANTGT